MANSDPQTPQEPRPSNTEGPKIPPSEDATAPKGTDEAFFEIISELSDLSTDQPNDETLRSGNFENSLNFPRAPWVDPYFSDPDAESTTSLGQASGSRSRAPRGPRDWDDDSATLEHVDKFVAPDPEFELSADPARNLGWFLVGFSLVVGLIVFLFMRPINQLTLGILGVLLLCGAGLLIWRMPSHRDHDDPSSGAQV